MSFRTAIRPSLCKSISWTSRTVWPTLSASGPGQLLVYEYPGPSRLVLRKQHRGAKRKVTIKANDLPQGQLAPIPSEPSDDGPSKQYPTVLQQHLNNMRKFSDCIILTRIGDFYEMYFDQVDQYAHLVNLKKAKRATLLGDVPMAGFQHTQLDRYLKMFVQDLGKQVAISEQIRIPDEERVKSNGGMMYDRKVTRVITAGTLIDESFVDPYENNYLLAVHISAPPPDAGRDATYERIRGLTTVGLSWVDLSSGDFYLQASDIASLPSVIARIGPREVVFEQVPGTVDVPDVKKLLGEAARSVFFHRPTGQMQTVSQWSSMLERPVPEEEHNLYTREEIAAGNLVLDYVGDRLQGVNVQLQPPVRRFASDHMAIDKQSLRGLEIKTTSRDGFFQGSLLHAVRRTVTKSGARLLSQRLVSPSLSLSVINARLDLVNEVLQHDALREEIVTLLCLTSDTLRLLQRFSIGKGDADDLIGLARTIQVMIHLSERLRSHLAANREAGEDTRTSYGFLSDLLSRLDLDAPKKVAKEINSAIDEEGLNRQHSAEMQAQEEASEMVDAVTAADEAGEQTPKLARKAAKQSLKSATSSRTDTSGEDIWIMRRNASPTLARAHEDLGDLLAGKHDLVIRLRKELNAESLTLKWSAGLGHFCHVKGKDSRANLSKVTRARIVSSTKTTRSFYLTDWTHLGVRIEDAKSRIRAEEERVLAKLRAQVIENLMKLRRNAVVLDELDVTCSSAIVAKERNLVRPILDGSTAHTIIGGRHPTVDGSLEAQGLSFTANDCTVGSEETLQLITGPNMAGKSTYLRQNALITVLAQTGCFVPASYAKLGLVDSIFSRIGSADNLYQDQSTFMVEMLETAQILKQASPRSFVIMDEVGRGTTPEDGIAVAYACLHHLHYVNKCRALFATHFHALADMTSGFDKAVCYCTDVAEQDDGSWVYVHKLRRGVNRDSHALKVARLAGMPEEAINVALSVLEAGQKGSHCSQQIDQELLRAPTAAAAGT